MKRSLLLFSIVALVGCAGRQGEFRSHWPAEVERVWPGPEYWSNPLQDWRVHNGRLENIVAGVNRNVYLLTREVDSKPGNLKVSVKLGRLEEDTGPLKPGFVGFRVGIRGAFHDYRDSAVHGFGMNAGLACDGRLFIGKLEEAAPKLPAPFQKLELRLSAEPAGSNYRVVLAAYNDSGDKLAQVVRDDIPPEWLTGGLALVSSSGKVKETPPADMEQFLNGDFTTTPRAPRGGTTRFWFKDWTVSGSKVVAREKRAFGPILWSMYTLSRKVMKLSAQMAPVGNAPKKVWLEIQEGNQWKQVADTTIDPDARTATFKVTNWDDTKDTPYRVCYRMPDTNGLPHDYHWSGTIRKDPVDQEKIVVAAFTGNNDLGFPHADIVRNVSHFKPDLLVYTGDNIYENVGDYGTQRSPLPAALLDYLRKWYEYGWEYRELLKDIPAVALPDDHDVYQGNIWGAEGRHAVGKGYEGQDQGGYTMPAEWVNTVQRTQTADLPDPYDPTPVKQGITVYYTDILYGGVSFAVLADRKWKSAPEVMLPFAKVINGWAQNPRYNAAKQGGVPGAKLLGDRQLEFLGHWAADWSGDTWMKVVLSQTPFADIVTLPKGARSDAITPKLPVMKPGEYPPDEWPVADHDSGGWPQPGRDKALRVMRKAFAFHISGDQHLGTTIHNGIDQWNDACWTISVPAISNIWPRRWYPSQPGRHHQAGMPRYAGEYLDGFGNKMTVYAVANPQQNGIKPVALFDRAPGYGIVTFDRKTRKITIANWPRWVDTSKPAAEPYPGWPITIDQLDNGYPKNGLVLEAVKSQKPNPVIQVVDEASGNVVYTFRIQGDTFTPRVRKPGAYTIKVLDTEAGTMKTYDHVKARRP